MNKKTHSERDICTKFITPNRIGYGDITAITEKAAADIEITRTWNPRTLKHDGKRGGSEKGFRK